MKTMMIKNDCPLAGCGLRLETEKENKHHAIVPLRGVGCDRTIKMNKNNITLLSPCGVWIATKWMEKSILDIPLLSPCGVWVATSS